MTNRTFMTVEEVAAELDVSKSYAYKIVKQLNEELKKLVIIPELSEPPVRTLGATIPENESHIFR